jgi:hypothetical protein
MYFKYMNKNDTFRLILNELKQLLKIMSLKMFLE